MKASAFLKLVSEMMASQQKYFKTRTQMDLIAAKEFEHRVREVMRDGELEPDAPATTASTPDWPKTTAGAPYWPTTIVSADEERQLRLHLEDERDAGENETYLEEDDE
jgi:hypothetical protein